MGRPKGSKNKSKVKALKSKKLQVTGQDVDKAVQSKKVDVAIQNSKRMRYQEYLDKFDNWKVTVMIFSVITIIMFCIVTGLIIKLL